MQQSRLRNYAMRLVILLTVGSLILTGLLLTPPAQAAGTITGVVFRDFNADGIRDVGEPGVDNISVTAYDSAGVDQGTITTSDTGAYSLNATGTGPYRVEFSGWPDYLQPGAYGTDNGTSVQFITDADLTNGETVDFALHNPAEYCDDNPDIASSCFSSGDPLLPSSGAHPAADRPGIVTVPFNPPTTGTDDNFYPTTSAQVGATWGLTYQRSSRTLLAAAVVRRHSGFGPDGIGAIYRVDPSGIISPSLLIDLNTAGFPTGTSVGTITRTDLTADSADPNRDPNAFDAVGKEGIGGISLSEDESTLWVMNLHSRSLLEIQIGVPATTPSAGDITVHTLPTVTCSDGEFRPWAVKVYQGQVYVGGVCSGELPYSGKNTDTSDLSAHIYRHDPAGADGNFTPVFDFPLDYPRGYISSDNSTNAAWLPWIDEWSDIGAPMPTPDGGPFGQTMYPQPMFTAIEFDTDGSMVLGLNDRAGMQLGNENYGPNDSTTYEGVAAGDILRVCVDSTGAYSLENNGSCGNGLDGTGINNGQGPGSGEFFGGDNYGSTHQEVTLGGLTFHPGQQQVISTAYDPVNQVRSGGFRWFNTSNGTFIRGYTVFGEDQVIGTNPAEAAQPSSMGKAAGLGDVELLCDQAPIEIGNRVWQDTDGDGVQDPDELPIQGVTVELYRDGILIGEATTDANGEYYFTSGTDPNDSDTSDNVIHDNGVGIHPRTGTPGGDSEYEIRIPNANGASQQAALNGLSPTRPDADTPPDDDDIRDSDGISSGTDVVYTIPYADLAAAGYNNHTYDFGFTPADWGDLPDGNASGSPNYNTDTTGTPGPSHAIIPELRIGATEDAETNGQPTAGADGDDTTGTPDDEDGVTLPTFIAGRSADVTVSVANTTGQLATLYGFIDFNGDGDFADAGEQVTTTVPTGTTGDDTLTFDVPAGADTTQNLGARFRLSTDIGLGPDGPAPDGEVEDYLISVTPTYSLGNRVWEDVNNDGVISAGEPGIAGATVRLLDGSGNDIDSDPTTAGIQPTTTTTDADGYYRFDGLDAGDYIVEVETPTGYISSTPDAGDPDTDADDSDDNGTVVAGANMRSEPVTLGAPGEPLSEGDLGPGGQGTADAYANMTVDFGFYQPVSVGDFVWLDTNGDGIQDAGEPGLAGATVTLYDATGTTPITSDADGNSITPVTTDSSGAYSFTNLPPGQYTVAFDPPTGYLPTQTGRGSDATDSNGLSAQSAVLDSGESDPDLDSGFFAPVSVGDVVWFDTNANGVQDAGEPGLAGATVTLYDATGTNEITTDADGNSITSITTGTDGAYSFTNLPPGQYTVQFTPPSGYLPTQTGQGTDATDSNGLSAQSAVLDSGENDPNLDSGFFTPVNLGDQVWYDANDNGLLDPGETGIAGVDVQLFRSGDDPTSATPVATQTTDSDGLYAFTNLTPGDYFVYIPNPPADYPFSSTPTDTNDNGEDNDDNGNQSTPGGPVTSPVVTLTSGGEPTDDGDGSDGDLTIDFGFYSLSLGNRVWEDTNNNGILDNGETGVENVTVSLYADTNGDGTPDSATPIATMTTDAEGRYLFTGLDAGQYVIELTNLPAGYVSSNGAIGTNQAADGPYEPGIAESNNPADEEQDHGTQGDGTSFAADAIRSGTITLTVDSEPTGESDATLPTSVTNNPATDANTNTTIDFGIFQPAGLGDYVWMDTNNDGIQDSGENGVGGITVTLLDGSTGEPLLVNGNPITTTTDGTGYYQFSNLPPGSYAVEFSDLPPNTVFSPQDRGSDTQDSDADPTSGKTADVTLNAGDNYPDLDAGLYSPDAGLGDYVWQDNNRNGMQDEPAGAGIAGVTVSLYDGTTLVATDITDAGGYYQFSNLQPDHNYTVRLENPADFAPGGPLEGWELTAQNVGSDDSDSDAELVNSYPEISTATTAGPATNTPTYDFGFFKPAGLGDYVWQDNNRNGVQDTDEPPVPGVTVRLLDDSGNPIDDPNQPGVPWTTTTDSNGYYRFSDLIPGSYQVEFVPSSDYVFTNPNQGGDDTRDSDADPTSGRTAVVTLTPGASDLTLDVGLYLPLELGNLIWEDRNNNGVADPGEPGVPNATVNLYRDSNGDGQPDGPPIATTTTDANGNYRFNNLTPDGYIIEVVPPAGYSSSTGRNGWANGPHEPGIDGDADENNVDHGTAGGDAIRSDTINLVRQDEPTNDGDTNPDSNLTVDFGLFQPAGLGSRVWQDDNNNGQSDADEPGVPGITVTLYDASGNVVATTTTNDTGYYAFTNLTPGDYYLGFTDLPAGYGFTGPDRSNDDVDSDVDPTTGITAPVTLGAGQNVPNIWAGLSDTGTTAIKLNRFSATRQGDQIIIRWETGMEINTWGYHLYRTSDGDRAHAERVTPALILAQGRGSAGAAYTWTDTDVAEGTTYSYWLQEVEIDETTSEYGPVRATPRVTNTDHQIFLPLMQR